LPGRSLTTAARPHRTLLGVGQLGGQNLRKAISERVMLEVGGRAIARTGLESYHMGGS
jgi:hypothetical protein